MLQYNLPHTLANAHEIREALGAVGYGRPIGYEEHQVGKLTATASYYHTPGKRVLFTLFFEDPIRSMLVADQPEPTLEEARAKVMEFVKTIKQKAQPKEEKS